jgi:hypothetical protein
MQRITFTFITATLLATGNLSADLIGAKEALELTKKEYENSYVANKISCDNTLNEINIKIKESIQKQTRSIRFNYHDRQNLKGWNYDYFYETCPLPTLKYQIIKKGYDLQPIGNLTDNHMLIAW